MVTQGLFQVPLPFPTLPTRRSTKNAGFFLGRSRPGGCRTGAMRRARERKPMRLWITLGKFLAQPGSYPHKTPPPESCCRRAPHFARAAPHTLQRRKCAPALKKKRLSTQTGVLYYYCYLYIKPLKNNQNPQSGHLSTAGDRPIGRLDKLTDRRLMPEWGSTGSARRSCPVDRSHP